MLQSKDKKFAYDIYEDAEKLPQTQTEQELIVNGYILNGNLIRDNDNLLICFEESTCKPRVLKTLTENEYNRMEKAFRFELSPHIIKTQLIRTEHDKYFAIMPVMPSTLESVKKLSGENMSRFWKQISSALESLHSRNFAHMDVKPSNICINDDGDFVLIDLGSVASFESTNFHSTEAYQPKNPINSSNKVNYKVASAIVDWWMLAATLAERGCDLNGWGEGASNPTTQKTLKYIEDGLPHIWSELKNKLKIAD